MEISVDISHEYQLNEVTVYDKKNCWQMKRCGREPDGDKVSELGVCPAATSVDWNGLNDGHNGGRICWAIVGTFCEGTIQGEFAKKLDTCIECIVYKTVLNEEGDKFRLFQPMPDETPTEQG